MADWKPIETAPAFSPDDENIERLLLWVANGGPDGKGDVSFGWVSLSSSGKRTPRASGYSQQGWTVTHWMPLPEAPGIPS